MSLNNQSNRLSDLGRREEALAAIEEAVTIRRELARARPDAFLPDLAMSLNNQSHGLSDLGRREEALAAIEEAVTIRRQLARARPDAFLPDLATSLNNQSVRLSDLGRREEALAAIEEAVTIYRQLAHVRSAVFASQYASSLKTKAMILSALGRSTKHKALVTKPRRSPRNDTVLPSYAGTKANGLLTEESSTPSRPGSWQEDEPTWVRIGRTQNTLYWVGIMAAAADPIPGHIGGYARRPEPHRHSQSVLGCSSSPAGASPQSSRRIITMPA